MTITIELGRSAPMYTDILPKWHWDRRGPYPPIYDIEYSATHDSDASMRLWAKQQLNRFPKDALAWLVKSEASYRIEAVEKAKPAPSRLSEQEGQPMLTHGYVFNVVMEDQDLALLFKLTFGGAA